MAKVLVSFLKDESGSTAQEYALVAALISVALLASQQSLGDEVEELFNAASGSVQSAANIGGGFDIQQQ